MDTKVYFIELNDLEFQSYEKYAKLLATDKSIQLWQFRFDIDKKLSLFADLFIRYLACIELKLNNDDLRFSNNAFGKPFLKGFPKFQYNVSHTKNALVIAVSEKPIGVDIEKFKDSDMKIARRFFHNNEIEYILSSKNQDEAFYEIWTKKEAYIKWVGKGLSMLLKSFDVTSYELAEMIRGFRVEEYTLAVCCEDIIAQSEVEILTETRVAELFSTFAGFAV